MSGRLTLIDSQNLSRTSCPKMWLNPQATWLICYGQFQILFQGFSCCHPAVLTLLPGEISPNYLRVQMLCSLLRLNPDLQLRICKHIMVYDTCHVNILTEMCRRLISINFFNFIINAPQKNHFNIRKRFRLSNSHYAGFL